MAKGLQSFLNDMAALMRRRKDDLGKRQSLFEGIGPGNVGNTFEIEPSQSQFANTYSAEAYGIPVRVLDIAGDDALGEMICVSIQQERIVDDAKSAASFAGNDVVEGPLVGIVEYGAGSGLGTFEFDIPAPNFTPGFVSQVNAGNTDPPDNNPLNDSLLVARRVNGVFLTLPASSMRVLIRNDANAPYLLRGTTTGADQTTPVSLNEFKNPAKVRVHATYGRRPFQAALTRTIPICFAVGNEGLTGPTQSFAPDPFTNTPAFIRFNIPAFAKRVRFPRLTIGSTVLQVSFSQSQLKGSFVISNYGTHTIPMGSEGPLEISPYDTFIEISNPGPNPVYSLSAVFELGV